MSYTKRQNTIVHHNEGAGRTRRETRGRAEQRKYNKVSKKEFSAREIKQIERMMDSRIYEADTDTDAAVQAPVEESYKPSKQEQRNMAKYKRNRQDQKYENTMAVFINENSETVVLVKQQDEYDFDIECIWTHSYEDDDDAAGLRPIYKVAFK